MERRYVGVLGERLRRRTYLLCGRSWESSAFRESISNRVYLGGRNYVLRAARTRGRIAASYVTASMFSLRICVRLIEQIHGAEPESRIIAAHIDGGRRNILFSTTARPPDIITRLSTIIVGKFARHVAMESRRFGGWQSSDPGVAVAMFARYTWNRRRISEWVGLSRPFFRRSG